MENNRNMTTPNAAPKAAITAFSEEGRRDVIAQYADDVVAKMTSAFFEVVSRERWGKRDLAAISGLNETAIGHILSGRRKNLTAETIALLARAMKKRPELVLHDTRPTGNNFETVRCAEEALSPRQFSTASTESAASARTSQQWLQNNMLMPSAKNAV